MAALVMLATATGARAEDVGCSVATFQEDAGRAVEQCNLALAHFGLDDGARAAALKIRARALHLLGRLDAAIDDYELALSLAPNDPELHVRRGWTAYDEAERSRIRRGSGGYAWADLQPILDRALTAVSIDNGYAPAFDLATAVMSACNCYQQALDFIDRAIQLEPTDPWYHYHRFQILDRLGRAEEALAEIDTAMRLPHKDGHARISPYYKVPTKFATQMRLRRAQLLERMGRHADAEAAYDQAVAADPMVLTFALRARFRMARSAPDDLIKADIDRALALDPHVWVTLEVLGKWHFYARRYDDALLALTRAVEANPENGEDHWWRALVLRNLDRLDDAVTEALTAYRVDRGFFGQKAAVLRKRGYLQDIDDPVRLQAALRDAVRACMIDDGCW